MTYDSTQGNSFFHLSNFLSCFDHPLIHSIVKHYTLLVACYTTLHPAMSVHWLVGLSVGRLVGQSPFFFLSILSTPLLPRCPSDPLQHCSCPPALDQGSRVSGLVNSFAIFDLTLLSKCLNAAPAHSQSAGVAVYPVLLIYPYHNLALNQAITGLKLTLSDFKSALPPLSAQV